jgi:hypothetical protein
MKLVVNQAYDNMGLQSTQPLGPILDGIMRNTPEGRAFIRHARNESVPAAAHCDAPFSDYSQAPATEKPRKRCDPPRTWLLTPTKRRGTQNGIASGAPSGPVGPEATRRREPSLSLRFSSPGIRSCLVPWCRGAW